MKLSPSLSAAAPLALLLSEAVSGETYKIPDSVYQGSSHAEYKSGLVGLDGQKVTPAPNATSYEWWYFDVASTSSANESVVVVFYESTPDAFVGGYPGSFVSVGISGSFANGSLFSVDIPATNGSSAVIETTLEGASGNWESTGISFEGASLLNRYEVNLDNPAAGVQGQIVFNSVAAAHYPCGPALPFSSEVICPHVGWSNAIPDAAATVELTVQGEKLSFTGLGYHDKNWGDVPFVEAVQSWYWGHGRLGPYSVVWFDALSRDGNEYVSAYVAWNGIIVGSSCKAGSVKVRPYGGDSQYPPTTAATPPDGFSMEFDLGPLGKLEANASIELFTVDTEYYDRFMGRFTGGIVGQEQFEGKAMGEQFKFPVSLAGLV